MSTANPTLTLPGSNSCLRVERRVTKCFVTHTNQLYPEFRGEWCSKDNESTEFTISQVKSKYLQRVGRETQRERALSYGHFVCLLFGARNVFIKRSLEISTSRKYLRGVFSVIACSSACRAVHRQCVPKYSKWVGILFVSFKYTQIPELPDAVSSADSWWLAEQTQKEMCHFNQPLKNLFPLW
jgi:hypothetical protein